MKDEDELGKYGLIEGATVYLALILTKWSIIMSWVESNDFREKIMIVYILFFFK